MSAREEALKAIEHVKAMLAKELTPLERKIAIATLEHVAENVAAIQEVKRRRREAPAPTTDD